MMIITIMMMIMMMMLMMSKNDVDVDVEKNDKNWSFVVVDVVVVVIVGDSVAVVVVVIVPQTPQTRHHRRRCFHYRFGRWIQRFSPTRRSSMAQFSALDAVCPFDAALLPRARRHCQVSAPLAPLFRSISGEMESDAGKALKFMEGKWQLVTICCCCCCCCCCFSPSFFFFLRCDYASL